MDSDFIERHNLRFVYYGDGPLRAELAQKVSKVGFGERIIFKGLIPHEEVGACFKAADAYLIPSQFEGTPLALLEALFHGLPAIGSDIDGIADIIVDGRSGLLFRPLDGAGLIHQIKTLVQSPELARALSEEGKRIFDSNYSFSRVMDRHLDILRAASKSP
jgi:glycosyltransferase involved in cell wall biosynthesis